MKPAAIEELYSCLEKAIPNPTTELKYTNPFTLLCAVVMSAQMTDSGVNRATEPLFKVADTPKKMLKLGEDSLREYIKSINFNNTKAKNVIALSKKLIDLHKGEVPRDREALEALPGVGRKTANVILNTAFGEKAIAVDTHVLRVSNRTGLAKGETPDAVEAKLMKVTPAKYMQDAHHLLILHGRYICKAKKPECPRCPIIGVCEYKAKTTEAKVVRGKKGK